MAAVTKIAEEALGGGPHAKHMNDALDIYGRDVAMFADVYVNARSEAFESLFKEDGLMRAAGFAYALGFIAGAYYKDLDDHTWKEEDSE